MLQFEGWLHGSGAVVVCGSARDAPDCIHECALKWTGLV